MKRLPTIMAIICFFGAYAQDTTSWRAAGVGINDEISFFKTDRTELTLVPVSGPTGPGHAIFMNPADSLLYVLQGDWASDRNLYSVNPFTGVETLVQDFAADYFSTMDISEDGNTLYGIQGQAATVPGSIVAINWGSWIESPIGTFVVDPNNSSFGVEYHPSDSSLYAFEGSWAGLPNLQTFDLSTSGYTSVPLTGFPDNQIHGARFTGVNGIFEVYTGQDYASYDTDATSSNLTLYDLPANVVNDIDEMWTLRRPSDVITLCPNATDSTMISLIYDVPVFSWYKDGVVLPLVNDTIMVFDAGVYQALYQIDALSYMWSEPIEIVHATVPVVNISQALNDTLICPNDTIVLNGASGGTLQWYLDGNIIVGANGNTYGATVAGSYNQMKTNASGCSDTAVVAYVIYDDQGPCGAGLVENNLNVSIYPNPVENELTLESSVEIKSISIVDVQGVEIFTNEFVNAFNTEVDFSKMADGVYFINVKTTHGEEVYKILK